jgi:hypothetical protein
MVESSVSRIGRSIAAAPQHPSDGKWNERSATQSPWHRPVRTARDRRFDRGAFTAKGATFARLDAVTAAGNTRQRLGH